MKSYILLILTFIGFISHSMGQYLSQGSNLNITSSTTYSGASIYGGTTTIASGVTVIFTGGVSLSNSARLVINTNAKVIITNGGISINNSSRLTANGAFSVRNGGLNISSSAQAYFYNVNKDTIIGNVTLSNSTVFSVDAPTELYISGNVLSTSSATMTINGSVAINGSYTSWNSAVVTGNGDLTTSNGMTAGGSSTIFNNNNFNCTSNCSGRNKCTYTNTIITNNQTVCGPGTVLDGNTITGTVSYTWESTTNLNSTNFNTVSGSSNTENYTIAAISQTTYYRRRAVLNGCTSYSQVITITYSTLPTPAPTTISASRCGSGSVTLTTSTTAPSYRWYVQSVGGIPISGVTGNTYVTPTLFTTTTFYVSTINANGCESSRTAVTATINNCTRVWNGSVSTQWTNAGNWTPAIVPTTVDSVVIPSGTTNKAILSTTTSIKSLTIAANAQMENTANSSMTLSGQLSNYGQWNNLGTIQFIGSVNSTIISSGATYQNIIINGSKNIVLADALVQKGELRLLSGTLVSNGRYTLNLDLGSISPLGTGSISGNMTVTRTVDKIKAHYFAVPLDGVTMADLMDDVEVIAPSTGKTRLFEFDQVNYKWVAINNASTPLIRGKAYSLYFTQPTVIDFTGTYNHNYVYTVTLNNNTNNVQFVPNPYPSTIDWNATSGWTKTNVYNNIYIWDTGNSRYMTYASGVGLNGGTNLIPSMQGFWIRTNGQGGTATLTFNKNVQSNTQLSVFYSVTSDAPTLKLTISDSLNKDELAIRFHESASDSIEFDTDALKIVNSSSMINSFTKANNQNMAVNTMHSFQNDTLIPLFIKVPKNGWYNIRLSSITDFNTPTIIKWIDHTLGDTMTITSGSELRLNLNKTDSENRFSLLIEQNIPTLTTSINTVSSFSTSPVAYISQEVLYVKKPEQMTLKTIVMYTLSGNQVGSYATGDLSEISLEGYPSGTYLIVLKDQQEKSYSYKCFKE